MARHSTLKRLSTLRRWMVCFSIAAAGVIAWSPPAVPQAQPPVRQPTTPKSPHSSRLPKTSRAAAIRLVQDFTSPARKREREIWEKLAKKVTVDLKGETLGGSLKQLAKLGGFDLIVDPEAVDAGDILLDTEMDSTKLEQKSYRYVIEYILSNHTDTQLTMLMQDGVVKVLTFEKADSIQTARVYPIAALRKPKAPVTVLPQTPAGITILQGVPQLAFDNSDTPVLDAVKSMNSGIWEEDDPDLGGSIDRVGDYLVVKQTQMVLEEIEGLLRGLEVAAKNELKGGAYQVRHPHHDHAADLAAERTLRKTISVDYKSMTLTDVFKDLHTKHGLQIVADPAAVDAGDLILDLEVTLNVKSCAVRSVLNLVLEEHSLIDLSYRMDEGVATVMTQEKADSIQNVMIYDIRDFLAVEIDANALTNTFKGQTTGIWEEDDPDLGGKVETVEPLGVLVIRQTDNVHAEVARLLTKLRTRIRKTDQQAAAAGQPKKTPPTDDTFVKQFYPFVFQERATAMQVSLTKFVAPKTWSGKDTEAAIAIVEGTLIIRQTVKVHRAIQEFLRKLDKAERLNTDPPGSFGGGPGGANGAFSGSLSGDFGF